ncbi:hypothetical protein D9M68_948110 [compost metagenome]
MAIEPLAGDVGAGMPARAQGAPLQALAQAEFQRLLYAVDGWQCSAPVVEDLGEGGVDAEVGLYQIRHSTFILGIHGV